MVRFLQIFIILFWIGTTSWLVWVIWTPYGSGFVEMDQKEAVDAFFKWNESDSFSILENGKRIGQATISGSYGEDAKNPGEIIRALSMTGSLYENTGTEASAGKVIVSWRIAMAFDESDPAKLKTAQITIMLPAQQVKAVIDLLGDPPQIRARATLNELPVFQYSGSSEGMPDLPESLTSGLASGVLKELANSADNFEPEISAKRGTAVFGGRELPVFLIEIKPPIDQTGIRIFLSQAGEPLKIDTDFGLEATSDVLVPLKTFKDSAVP